MCEASSESTSYSVNRACGRKSRPREQRLQGCEDSSMSYSVNRPCSRPNEQRPQKQEDPSSYMVDSRGKAQYVLVSGPKGERGEDGRKGPRGYDGCMGCPGDPGGPTGPTGSTGYHGDSSMILSGRGPPTMTVCSKAGTLYLDSDSGYVYYNSGNGWQYITSMLGPTGWTGQVGATGATGPKGETGPYGNVDRGCCPDKDICKPDNSCEGGNNYYQEVTYLEATTTDSYISVFGNETFTSSSTKSHAILAAGGTFRNSVTRAESSATSDGTITIRVRINGIEAFESIIQFRRGDTRWLTACSRAIQVSNCSSNAVAVHWYVTVPHGDTTEGYLRSSSSDFISLKISDF